MPRHVPCSQVRDVFMDHCKRFNVPYATHTWAELFLGLWPVFVRPKKAGGGHKLRYTPIPPPLTDA